MAARAPSGELDPGQAAAAGADHRPPGCDPGARPAAHPGHPRATAERKTGFSLGDPIFALLATIVRRDRWTQAQTVETPPDSRFEQPLADGRIGSVEIGDGLIMW